MIPLEAIPQANEDTQEHACAKDLVDAKFPSRPRRKVVIILGVIAVLTVVIVAASLIGKYVPNYLSDANSSCKSVFPQTISASNSQALLSFILKSFYTSRDYIGELTSQRELFLNSATSKSILRFSAVICTNQLINRHM